MQFFCATIAALSLASSVFAAPHVPEVLDVSAVGSVVQRNDSVLSVIISAVASLKTSIVADAASIATTVVGDVEDSIVPTVEADLVKITASVEQTIVTIATAVTGAIVPSTTAELQAVLGLLGDVQYIIQGIETALTGLVTVLSADALALLTSEIKIILSLVFPLVAPIATFASSVLATVGGSNGTVSQILIALGGVVNDTTTLLHPVGTLLSAIL